MNRLRAHLLPFLACTAVSVYWSCSGLQPIAGGTSETTNGFMAVVHDQNGSVVDCGITVVRPVGSIRGFVDRPVVAGSVAVYVRKCVYHAPCRAQTG